MRITNNRWAAVAGGMQWLAAVWCAQFAFNTGSLEMLAPSLISLLSGSMTLFGFLKHEMLNEEAEELHLERTQR